MQLTQTAAFNISYSVVRIAKSLLKQYFYIFFVHWLFVVIGLPIIFSFLFALGGWDESKHRCIMVLTLKPNTMSL